MPKKQSLRYEYRIFVQDLSPFKKLIEQSYKEIEQNSKTALYVLLKDHPSYNIKFQNDTLSIKKLLEIKDGFQKWVPLEESEAKQSLEALFEKEDIALQSLEQKSIQTALVGSKKGCTLSAEKNRVRYKKEDILCELTTIQVKQDYLRSICVESQDLEALKKELLNLGLQVYKNQSYRDKLTRLC